MYEVGTIFMAFVIGTCILIGILVSKSNKKEEEIARRPIRFSIETISNKPQSREVDNTEEAKGLLVSFGFTATEAKKMLREVGHCSNTEEYIRKTMKGFKI